MVHSSGQVGSSQLLGKLHYLGASGQLTCKADKYLEALDYAGGTILLVKYINQNFWWDALNILKEMLLYIWEPQPSPEPVPQPVPSPPFFTLIGSSQAKSGLWLDTQVNYPVGYVEAEVLKHTDLLLHMNMRTGTTFERLLKGDL